MIARTQWKVAYDQAHKNARGKAADKLLEKYISGWDFRNKLEDSEINCPAPLSDSILIEGRSNVFQVQIEVIPWPIDSNNPESLVSILFPNDPEYDADLYVFYTIDKSDEPWDPHFVRVASERLLKHHGWVKDGRVETTIRHLWRWNKFIGRLKNDLRSPNI